MANFLNLSEDIKKYFDDKAREEADKKLVEFFLRIFTEARKVAVDEKKQDVDIVISRDNWLEGYWSNIRSLRLKRRYPLWLNLSKLALFLLPMWIGYAASNPQTMYGQIIIAVVLSAAIFLIAQYLEDK